NEAAYNLSAQAKAICADKTQNPEWCPRPKLYHGVSRRWSGDIWRFWRSGGANQAMNRRIATVVVLLVGVAVAGLGIWNYQSRLQTEADLLKEASRGRLAPIQKAFQSGETRQRIEA